MLILALESSAKPASVAVCADGELLGQYFQNCGLTHSRTLLAMAESLLKNLDISIADIDLIAVSRGPGSFTGIRIGVSAAKGMAWGLDRPVCGVSTLEAMAYQVSEPSRPVCGVSIVEAMAYQVPEPSILLCPVMDARRSQVYNALFIWQEGALNRLTEDRAISLESLSVELQARKSSSTLLLIGDGAKITCDYLSSAGIPCRIAPEILRWQSAYGVALAAVNTEPTTALELEPCYLRPSQAERERAAEG